MPDELVRSLFILSLPRSLSTAAYNLCREAIPFKEPSWTSCGEILNNDRHILYGGDRKNAGLKFTAATDTERFSRSTDFLDQIVKRKQFCYKDVVQPFVASSWLKRDTTCVERLAVLRIVPDVAHVANRMLALKWFYPALNGCDDIPLPERVVMGLLAAERAILAVPGETVSFDQLIDTPEELQSALSRLYPQVALRTLSLHAPDFVNVSTDIRRRRESDGYLSMQELVRTLRERDPDAKPAISRKSMYRPPKGPKMQNRLFGRAMRLYRRF